MIKENHTIVLESTLDYKFTVQTVGECADLCSQNKNCTAFKFTSHDDDQTTSQCVLYTYAEIERNSNATSSKNVSAGLCPKSKTMEYDGKEIKLPITTPKFLCSEEEPDKHCHFPFLYQGELQWDSVKDDHGKCQCSIDKPDSDTKLYNHTTVATLTDCTNCSSGN